MMSKNNLGVIDKYHCLRIDLANNRKTTLGAHRLMLRLHMPV